MATATRSLEERSLYDSDYYGWIQNQVEALRQRRLNKIDARNVAEELDDLGKSIQGELESRLEVAIAHLLKWAYDPKRRSASWENTIDEQRTRIHRVLAANPSLRSRREEAFVVAYHDARRRAGNDMKKRKAQ